MKVKLKAITPNIEQTIVEIARVSSSREDKSAQPEGLINYLIRNKHWSPFEHGFITFEVETSKAIAIQVLRHRSNYFQEFSQRYQDVGKLDDIIFELYDVRLQAETNRQSSTETISELKYREDVGYYFDSTGYNITNKQSYALQQTAIAYNLAERAYRLQLDSGISRETARFVLPIATKTKLYITMNVRSAIHWLDLRDDGHAQKEIQLIAREIKNILIDELPIISNALQWKK